MEVSLKLVEYSLKETTKVSYFNDVENGVAEDDGKRKMETKFPRLSNNLRNTERK